MKPLFVSISLLILFIGCKRDWDHPLFTDEDLINTPNIVQIDLDSDNNANIILDYAYSDSSIILLERRSIGGFETVNYIRKTQVTLLDTAFDKEIDHDFVYRIYVKKGNYRTPNSDEEQLKYISPGLNRPLEIATTTVELQGINLFWQDKSNHENKYIIEKDEGGGFNEVAELPANSESHFDVISGIPDPPSQLTYRIKAVNSTKESDWTSITLAYAGIGSPSNLRITDTIPFNFRLEWDDNSNIETGYSIERSKDSEQFTEIASIGSDTSSYSDVMEELGNYSYRVRAIKESYYSSYSNEVNYELISYPLPTDGLIAYYPFNGNANDESGNGNDGSVLGDASVNKILVIGRNASDRVSLPYTIFNGLVNFSISAYVKINTLQISGGTYNSNNLITVSSSSTMQEFRLVYGEFNHSWYFQIKDETIVFDTSIIIEDKEWHHIFFYRNENTAKIFIDSFEIGNGVEVSISELKASTNGVIIGQEQDAVGGNFDKYQSWAGEIDNLRIYNRALSQEEIKALYQESGWGE